MPHRTNYFVSDLHLFSRRSLAPRHYEALQSAASQARTFVLGGDIFDFRWSMYASADESVRHAIRWIDELVGSHSRCDFHFVQGNHDCNSRFVAALEAYGRTRPNLTLHPYFVRLGKSVFLHGDVADRPQICPAKLKIRRQHWSRDEAPRGPMRHALYDLAIQARLHRLAGKVAHPRKQVAARILGYLDLVGEGPEKGIEHVYFGHTHDALTNYRHQGVTFHNPGAPIAGLQFRIVETVPHG